LVLLKINDEWKEEPWGIKKTNPMIAKACRKEFYITQGSSDREYGKILLKEKDSYFECSKINTVCQENKKLFSCG